MTLSCKAAAVLSGSEGTEEATPLGSKTGDVQFPRSRQSTCDTCNDGVDEELRLVMHRRLQCLEGWTNEASKKREQDLAQQLLEARTEILAKAREVSTLQAQLLEELTERQKLQRKVMEQFEEICRLQESPVGSQALASDGQNCDVSKTAVENRSSLKAGTSNVANSVQPTLPQQDMMFTPQVTPRGAWQQTEQSAQNNFCQQVRKVETALSSPRLQGRDLLNFRRKTRKVAEALRKVATVHPSPRVQGTDLLANHSTRASLGQQFKFHACEKSRLLAVPPQAQPCTGP